MTTETIHSLVKHLFRDDKVDTETLSAYERHLGQFGSEWQTAREALGDDWRYADSLHAAGLLALSKDPIIQGGRLAGHTTYYRICGISRDTGRNREDELG